MEIEEMEQGKVEVLNTGDIFLSHDELLFCFFT